MYCWNCGTLLFEGASFCHQCGARAAPSPLQTSSTRAPQKKSTKKGKLVVIAVIIIGLLIATIVGSYFVSNLFFGTYPKSGLLKASGAVCYPFSSNITASESTPSFPNYDEQLYLLFNQNLSSSLQYNISAVGQNESLGNGPTYLLNGLTDSNYWYQVGLGWNGLIANTTEVGYYGFSLVYEVYNASNGHNVFPYSFPAAEGVNFSGPVREGDTLLLSLKIQQGSGLVNASIFDWNTKAYANDSSSSYHSTKFLSAPFSSYGSGLMTEWYVTASSFCSENKVVYSNSIAPLESGMMCIDEIYYSNSSVIYSACSGIVYFFPTFGRAYQSFSYFGHTIYSTPFEFVTS